MAVRADRFADRAAQFARNVHASELALAQRVGAKHFIAHCTACCCCLVGVVLGDESDMNVLERFSHVMRLGQMVAEESVRRDLVDLARQQTLAERIQ